jgi:hypothetical protein
MRSFLRQEKCRSLRDKLWKLLEDQVEHILVLASSFNRIVIGRQQGIERRMQIINVKHSLRYHATDSERLGDGRGRERFYPFLAPARDRQVIRALRITCLCLHTHVFDGVLDVLVEASDVERLDTTVDGDIQGLEDVSQVRRYNVDKNVVVGKTLCVERSDMNTVLVDDVEDRLFGERGLTATQQRVLCMLHKNLVAPYTGLIHIDEETGCAIRLVLQLVEEDMRLQHMTGGADSESNRETLVRAPAFLKEDVTAYPRCDRRRRFSLEVSRNLVHVQDVLVFNFM